MAASPPKIIGAAPLMTNIIPMPLAIIPRMTT
jgi:hypothetical protein